MKKKASFKNSISIIGVLLFSTVPAMSQIDGNYREKQKKAWAASSITEYHSSLNFCNEVLNALPNHPFINYLAARLNAQLGNEDIALEQLNKATKLGYTTKLPFNKIHQLNDSAFITLREKEGFKQIIDALEKAEEPIHKSQVVFTIGDDELLPEGITYDPVEKMFYLGSETKHKIVKVDQHGASTDFTTEGQDGLMMVLGIHVDPVRRILWACSYEEAFAGIFKFNLSSGKLIKKYLLPSDGRRREFNDLVIHPNGDVYISTPGHSAIYLISHISDTLELFLKNDSIIGPNGITLSDDGQSIFLADIRAGIYKIDIETKSFILLSHEPDFFPYGIDGLYFANNKLHAVQILLNQISQFSLNEEYTHLEACDVFERNGLYLDKPTTGVIVDDFFYFIADTQGKGEILEGVIIMKTPIN